MSCPLQDESIGSGGGDLVDGSGGDLGGGSLGKGEAIGEVMKRDGGLVEAMGGCRPPTPAPAGWVRPWMSEALEATQGRMDGFFSQLPYKCYLEVASVGD